MSILYEGRGVTNTNLVSRLVSIVNVLGLSFVAIVFWFLSTVYFPIQKHFEDSYIIFRYADNLASGHGLAWNPGGPAEQGMTGLLWTLLLGGMGALVDLPMPELAAWVGLTCAALGLILVWAAAYQLLPTSSRFLAPLAPLILCFTPLYVRHAGSGLETSLLFAVIASVALVAALRGKLGTRKWFALAVTSTFLAFLVRPDAILMPAVAFGLIALLDPCPTLGTLRRTALMYALPLGALLALYGAIVISIFGYFMPLAVHLKMTGITENFRYILSNQAQFLSNIAPLLVVIGLALGLRGLHIRLPALALLTASGAFYIYLFTVIPIMNVGLRFQMPIMVLLAAAIPCFLYEITQQIETPRHRVVLSLLVAPWLVVSTVGSFTEVRNEAYSYLQDHDLYARAGQALAQFDTSSIASTEAGKLAYFSRLKFLDTVGLNSRFVAVNKNLPNYSNKLINYLDKNFGFPDVYIRPGSLGTLEGADAYAYLEFHIDLHTQYVCSAHAGITACVSQDAQDYHGLKDALHPLGFSLPEREFSK